MEDVWIKNAVDGPTILLKQKVEICPFLSAQNEAVVLKHLNSKLHYNRKNRWELQQQRTKSFIYVGNSYRYYHIRNTNWGKLELLYTKAF